MHHEYISPANHLELNEIELRIMKSISEGKNNNEIANELNYSRSTVKKIVSDIISKLYLKNRVQIAVYYSCNHCNEVSKKGPSGNYLVV